MPVVLGVMYLSSLITMTVVVSLGGFAAPSGDTAAAGLAAGLAGVLALGTFYWALSIGTMSIVAPVASTGVALPVVVGLLGGDDPGPVRAAGLVVAVVGVVIASREVAGPGAAAARRQRLSIALALAAGLGFGSYFVGAEYASRDGVAWALLLTRIAAAPVAVAAAWVALRRLARSAGPGAGRPGRGQIAALAGIGLLDLGANAAYNHASTIGELSTVSVASSLYPVVTVLLAAALLGERVRGLQRAGVVTAVIGVLLIAGGSSG